MRKKKIKTFSVDADAYDALVAMFRESGAEVSVSYYVDKVPEGISSIFGDHEGSKRTVRGVYSPNEVHNRAGGEVTYYEHCRFNPAFPECL